MLGITADSYDSVIWVTSHFSGHLNGWWLNRKTQAPIPSTYVAELRKTTFLPNIQDDAINALLNLTQSNMMSYAFYTKQYNDFLRRSRQNLTADVQCVRFINGLANFTLKNQAKSHRARKGYHITTAFLKCRKRAFFVHATTACTGVKPPLCYGPSTRVHVSFSSPQGPSC
jgi:hypothetical protein